QRLRELDALAHALAVRTDLLACCVSKVDHFECSVRALRGRWLVEAIESEEGGAPLHPGHAVVEGVLLRAKANPKVETGVTPNRLAEYQPLPLARFELAGDEFQECRLTRPVRSKQPGDAGRNGQCHVVQVDDLTVPLRKMIGGNAREWFVPPTTSPPRTRRSNSIPETTMRATIIAADRGQGVSYLNGSLKIASPTCLTSKGTE